MCVHAQRLADVFQVLLVGVGGDAQGAGDLGVVAVGIADGMGQYRQDRLASNGWHGTI